MKTLKANRFSLELFPPKTPEGFLKLDQICAVFQQFYPSFFSVTFGAGGAAQLNTQDLVRKMVQQNRNTVPHLSCVNMSKARLSAILAEYKQLGINRLVVIQGDLTDADNCQNSEFNYAHELVTAIREMTADHFHICVAAYPEYHPHAKSPDADLENFQRKIDAGANSAITQFFFSSDAYCRFMDACHKLAITIPIIPGIMPIHDYAKLLRFSTACGAEIPLWLRKRLETLLAGPEDIREIGIEVVTKLCERLLLDGAPGIHFYTLNQLEPTKHILHLLGVSEVKEGLLA
ncbi:MAG: methylenetetrahydrofolate reductase [NAD(P)H] [Gammaproteobacteria bacterium]|nr:methylenetetrahydrofolate reductase [NAD(P)H] [Gammaproteobacteria bacterium]